MRAVEDRHWWYAGNRRIVTDLLRACEPPLGRILDVGSGTGGNGALLSRFGSVVGLEPSEDARRLARGRSTVQVAGEAEYLPFRSGSFDLVTSFEVLYHAQVQDDIAALREMRRVLRPEGLLLLRLPALEWLRGPHDDAVETARRYTVAGLRAKLREADLWPIRLSYVNSLLLPAIALRRVWQRWRHDRGDDLSRESWLERGCGRVALAVERRLLRRIDLPLGVSVLAIARKS